MYHIYIDTHITPSRQTALNVLGPEGILSLFLDLIHVLCNTQHGLVGLTETAIRREIWIKLLHESLSDQ